MNEMANTSKAAATSSTTEVSSTTLQDLPNEILDYILMKAVVKKVMEKKLAKSAWLEYAVRVIRPLRAVSLQWNFRLTTNWFKIVLSRNIMRKDPVPISMERIARTECLLLFGMFGRLHNKTYFIDFPSDDEGDEMWEEDTRLRVFDGQDLTHHIKEISLPSLNEVNDEGGMAICKWSNSLYVWQCAPSTFPPSSDIWHLVPKGDGGIEVLEWPAYDPSYDSLDFMSCDNFINDLSVLDDGNVLVSRSLYCVDCMRDSVLSIHKPDGSAIRSIKLAYDAQLSNVTMKSNGNFVYAQLIDNHRGECVIRETDRDGKAFRCFHCFQRLLQFCVGRKHLFLDAYDRVIFHDGCYKFIFLDCELNFLGQVETLEMQVPLATLDDNILMFADFDKDANEIVVVHWSGEALFLKLTI